MVYLRFFVIPLLSVMLSGCIRVPVSSCVIPLAAVTRPDPGPLAVDFRAPAAGDVLSPAELAMYERLMAERAALGLPRIPLSKSLTLVAGRHAEDVSRNIIGPRGYGLKPGTNHHSWSDAPYPANHSTPKAMWQAPRRLGTRYCENGYEILAWGQSSGDRAIDTWMASASHGPVIRNTGQWKNLHWKAIGIGIAPQSAEGPAVYTVWFGTGADPEGGPARSR